MSKKRIVFKMIKLFVPITFDNSYDCVPFFSICCSLKTTKSFENSNVNNRFERRKKRTEQNFEKALKK